jgi:hypothetical protein
MISTQQIRLLDVFFIGPVMIYAGGQGRHKDWLNIALIGIGVATIIYNGNNYLKNKD